MESSPPQSEDVEKKNPLVRRVTWNEMARCRLISSHRYYSVEEYERSWYSPEEHRDMHIECGQVIVSLEKGDHPPPHDQVSNHCARGLEGHTRSGTRAKREIRDVAYNTAFREQGRQWDMGISNEETIAKLYRRASQSSVLQARMVGLQDQEIVDRISTDAMIPSRQ